VGHKHRHVRALRTHPHFSLNTGTLLGAGRTQIGASGTTPEQRTLPPTMEPNLDWMLLQVSPAAPRWTLLQLAILSPTQTTVPGKGFKLPHSASGFSRLYVAMSMLAKALHRRNTDACQDMPTYKELCWTNPL
jgi:hypothetical protein